MAEPRDLAVAWLTEVIHAVECGCPDGADDCDRDKAAAILGRPGVEVGVEYWAVGASGPYPTWREDADHQNVYIRLPAADIARGGR